MSELSTFPITIKTFAGLEKVLAEELASLGYKDVKELIRAVQFEGGKLDVYRCNYWLRTGISVLKNISSFSITGNEDLYENTKKIDWSEYISLEKTFAIESTVNSELFNHTNYPALLVKDAIADYFNERSGRRPCVNREEPDVSLNVHINGGEVNISINTSGDPLFKRGYKSGNHEAPLNEVVAAGLIRLSGWMPHIPFYDPMCGSGTIAIEAAMMALQIPPGKFRTNFRLQSMTDFDRKLWREAKRKGPIAPKAESVKIYASDINDYYVEMAEKNAAAAGVAQHIQFENSSFFFSEESFRGTVIMNPPYGVRMEEDIPAFYEEIGNTLKSEFTDCKAWIFSGAEEGYKHVGLKPFQKFELYNGNLPSWFYGYEVFEGSLEDHVKAKG